MVKQQAQQQATRTQRSRHAGQRRARPRAQRRRVGLTGRLRAAVPLARLPLQELVPQAALPLSPDAAVLAMQGYEQPLERVTHPRLVAGAVWTQEQCAGRVVRARGKTLMSMGRTVAGCVYLDPEDVLFLLLSRHLVLYRHAPPPHCGDANDADPNQDDIADQGLALADAVQHVVSCARAAGHVHVWRDYLALAALRRMGFAVRVHRRATAAACSSAPRQPAALLSDAAAPAMPDELPLAGPRWLRVLQTIAGHVADVADSLRLRLRSPQPQPPQPRREVAPVSPPPHQSWASSAAPLAAVAPDAQLADAATPASAAGVPATVSLLHAWWRDGQPFRRSNPGPPTFGVVVSAIEDAALTPRQLHSLYAAGDARVWLQCIRDQADQCLFMSVSPSLPLPSQFPATASS